MPVNSSYNERELLQLAASGDETAFARLFHDSKHKLYSFLMRLTQSPELTEDMIQDIFFKLWRNKQSIAEIENFSSYIFRMAQNQCITHFKRQAKETLILTGLQRDLEKFGMDPEHKLAAKEVQKKLQEAIAKLSPQQKLVFTLSREQGLKHEEIARQLNISVSTVKNHMVDALRILREHLVNSPRNIVVMSCLLHLVTAAGKIS